MYIIYGLDTKSIEDAYQCVLVDVPEHETDSPEALESWLEDHGDLGFSIEELIALIARLKWAEV